ncbi:unnamed protein product [Amaranthus hypochondriacus]
MAHSWTIFPIFLSILISQYLQPSSAQDQPNQPTNPVADPLKPPIWPGPVPWIFPAPKPDPKKEQDKGPDCNCNCKCDCPKTECESHSNAGPVVCLPMKCEGGKGCNFAGGMNSENAISFDFPSFSVAGFHSNGDTKSSKNMNEGHH